MVFFCFFFGRVNRCDAMVMVYYVAVVNFGVRESLYTKRNCLG